MANERAGEEGVCHAGEATLLAVQGHPHVPEVEAAHRNIFSYTASLMEFPDF